MGELLVSFRRPDTFFIDLTWNPPGISSRAGWAKDLRLANWFAPYDDDERLALAAVQTAVAEVASCHGCRQMLRTGDRSRCWLCQQEPVERIARHLAARLPRMWISLSIGDQPVSIGEHQSRLLREACARKRNYTESTLKPAV